MKIIIKDENKLNRKTSNVWFKWFAWYPIIVVDNKIHHLMWLEYVNKKRVKYTPFGYTFNDYEFIKE